jgi:23S rRNA A2030 N6-methylase RlmJ
LKPELLILPEHLRTLCHEHLHLLKKCNSENYHGNHCREPFLTLKNAALKQHDQIKALEFHTQEYQTHFKNLEWAKEDRGNKFILGFEYLVSNFGTNVWRSLVSYGI